MENIEYVLPGEIEKRSFAIIGEELKERGIVLPPEQEPVTKRVIHTSADFDYAKTMTYSPHAVQIAKELIAGGADIVTDTNMALAGINKKRLGDFGGTVHCFMADEDVAREAKARQVTRATVSMEHAANIDKPVIFAVGTSVFTVISLFCPQVYYGFGFLAGCVLFYFIVMIRLERYTRRLPYYILSIQPVVAEDKSGVFTRIGCFMDEKLERRTSVDRN